MTSSTQHPKPKKRRQIPNCTDIFSIFYKEPTGPERRSERSQSKVESISQQVSSNCSLISIREINEYISGTVNKGTSELGPGLPYIVESVS